MNRLLLAAGGWMAAAVSLLLAQQPAPPRVDPAALQGSVPIELVFLRDSGPLLLRVHVLQGGKPIQVAWRQYLEKWFDFLDRKKNDQLDEAALQGAPRAVSMRNLAAQGIFLGNRGQSLTLRDFGKEAGQTISRAEFIDYYDKSGVGPIQPTAAPFESTAQANEALFKHLDLNGDGKLSRAELEAARVTLAKFDLDDDELVSIRELVPGMQQPVGRGVIVQQPFAGPAPLQGTSFYHLNSESARAGLATLLLAHYDKDGAKRLGRTQLGLDEATFKALDKNRDGQLDGDELAAWPEHAPAVELVANLRPDNRTPALVVLKSAPLAPKALRMNGGVLSLALGDADLAVQNLDAGPGRVVVNQFNFLSQQIKAADVKMRGYVELSDLTQPQFQLLRQLFPILDRNEDGKVTEQEAQAYFDLQAQARNVMTSFFVQEQGRNWFQILDANHDGQLSPRELLSAWARLAPYDKNGDGFIEASELPLQFRVVFTGAGPQFVAVNQVGRRGMTAPGRGDNIYPPHAPLWFKKMDRNRDGDVSRREFLGSKEDFDRIDRNGDGLIDADEAAAATPKK